MYPNQSQSHRYQPSTSYITEIDELNRILLVERELVLKTQDNYRRLKEKYQELSHSYQQLRNEFESYKKDESSSRDENVMKLHEQSAEFIKTIQAEQSEREARREKFRLEVIEELKAVYKKELTDLSREIEKLKDDKCELVAENDDLLEKIRELHNDLEEQKRNEKQYRAEIRDDYDKKLMKIIENDRNNEKSIPKYDTIIDDLRQKIKQMEANYMERTKEYSASMNEKNIKIEEIRLNELELKQKIHEMQSTINSLNCEIESLKSERASIESKNVHLHDRLELYQKQNLELESKARQVERDCDQRVEESHETLTYKLNEYESICKQKDEMINLYEEKLKSYDDLHKMLDEAENSRMIEQENVKRLEAELKNLIANMDCCNSDNEKRIKTIKLERDQLQQSVAILKKQMETSPETIAEVGRLKKALSESERKRAHDKEKYQSALSSMKSALSSIERQQRNTHNKLRETLAAR